jgi:hypothetical protein
MLSSYLVHTISVNTPTPFGLHSPPFPPLAPSFPCGSLFPSTTARTSCLTLYPGRTPCRVIHEATPPPTDLASSQENTLLSGPLSPDVSR